jgi:arylsulfate sulfotransferase
MKKKLLIIIGTFTIIISSLCYLIFTYQLVEPTNNTLSTLQEVTSYDILAEQLDIEKNILLEYESSHYTFEDPYVIVDPYNFNPLSALVMFSTEKSDIIDITIIGKDDYSTFSYTLSVDSNIVQLPILGLYEGTSTEVILTNSSGISHTLFIECEPLPYDFQTYELVESHPEVMEEGITLFTACFEHSYTALLDCYGDVRGYLSNQRIAHGTSMILLENGHMLSTGDEFRTVPYHKLNLYEFNWLGKIFTEYQIPNAVHHDITELPNGDFLATSNNVNMFESGTNEDVVIIIDRETGTIKREYNFRDILDENRETYHHFEQTIVKNTIITDWMHTNGAVYDSGNNNIIVSSPIQSQVVSIDASTEQINWILGSHEGYEGSSAFLKQYLLTPTDNTEFPWGQHQPMILPDFDNNEDTIDIMLFDNGQSKSITEENAIDANNNYSRGVHYRINENEMTVEQLWQYGKERNLECYATFLGDANYLPTTNNRLITFGGQIRDGDIALDSIIDSVFGNAIVKSRVVEVTEDNDIVYEINVTPTGNDTSGETYQAKRIPLFIETAYNYTLADQEGKRLGTRTSDALMTDMTYPMFFTKNIHFDFTEIYVNDTHLIIDGTISDGTKLPTLGKAYIGLISDDNRFIFDTRASLNGRQFASIDLSNIPKGEYLVTILGGISDDNDLLTAQLEKGHYKSSYKITID